MRLIQAGIGVRGGHWIDFIGGRDDVEIVACVDKDKAALEKAQVATGCQIFESLDEARVCPQGPLYHANVLVFSKDRKGGTLVVPLKPAPQLCTDTNVHKIMISRRWYGGIDLNSHG